MRSALVSVILVALGVVPSAGQSLRIYVIDVEQADAALVVMPNGKSLLIDSGKERHGLRIKRVMNDAGVSRVDAFVNSHFHEDHLGGIDELVKMGVEVVASYDRGCCVGEAGRNAAFRDYLTAVGNRAHALRPGDVIDLDPEVTITCVAAGGAVEGISGPRIARDENDLSVSLLITFAGFKAYFGGDTEAATEKKLLARRVLSDIDVYKASHHGSDTSSSAAFLDALRPSVVLISNGSHGGHKHPRAVTLKALAALSSPPVVFQTNKCLHPAPCANVPDDQIADTVANTANGTIRVTVDKATNAFVVQYGSTARTFRTRSPTVEKPIPPVTEETTRVQDVVSPPASVPLSSGALWWVILWMAAPALVIYLVLVINERRSRHVRHDVAKLVLSTTQLPANATTLTRNEIHALAVFYARACRTVFVPSPDEILGEAVAGILVAELAPGSFAPGGMWQRRGLFNARQTIASLNRELQSVPPRRLAISTQFLIAAVVSAAVFAVGVYASGEAMPGDAISNPDVTTVSELMDRVWDEIAGALAASGAGGIAAWIASRRRSTPSPQLSEPSVSSATRDKARFE